jgi:hypothetical protein
LEERLRRFYIRDCRFLLVVSLIGDCFEDIRKTDMQIEDRLDLVRFRRVPKGLKTPDVEWRKLVSLFLVARAGYRKHAEKLRCFKIRQFGL